MNIINSILKVFGQELLEKTIAAELSKETPENFEDVLKQNCIGSSLVKKCCNEAKKAK